MKTDAGWQKYWRFLTARFRGEVEDEISFHIAMRARDLQAQGLPADVAEQEARRRFGDPRRIRTTLHRIEERRGRRMKWTFMFQELAQDMRYGARALFKRPGFTLMTAGSLALGIASVTVVLSVIDAYLLRPLPVRHPEQMVIIGASNQASTGMAAGVVGLPTISDIAARTELFQGVAAHTPFVAASRKSETDDAERGIFLGVTGNYFSVLGVSPALGRMFTVDEDRQRERVVVLSHRVWQSEFAADSGIVGKTIRVNTVEFVIVGVAPPEFHGTEFVVDPVGYIPATVLTALDASLADMDSRRNNGRFTVIARRKANRSIADINSALKVIARETQTAYPAVGEQYQLTAFPENRARPTLPSAGAMVAVAAAFATLALLVLVTASVNATNLILARGSTRATELAVRQALGASRGRLTRQLLVEVLLLALLACLGALAMARAAIAGVTRVPFTFDDLPLSLGIQLDFRVLGMTLAFALVVGIVAGIGPSLSASSFALQQRLRDGGRAGLTRQGRRARSALVVAQVAASLVVLVCAGLFIVSARQAGSVDLGFRADHLVTFGVDATLAHYDETNARRTFDRIEQSIEAPACISICARAWPASTRSSRASRRPGRQAASLTSTPPTRRSARPCSTPWRGGWTATASACCCIRWPSARLQPFVSPAPGENADQPEADGHDARRDGPQPGLLDAGLRRAQPVAARQPHPGDDQRGRQPGDPQLRRRLGGQGGAGVAYPPAGDGAGTARHHRQRDPGRRHRYARAAHHPRQRARSSTAALSRNPSGRLTTTEDVARFIVMWAGPGSQWATGNVRHAWTAARISLAKAPSRETGPRPPRPAAPPPAQTQGRTREATPTRRPNPRPAPGARRGGWR